MGQLLKQAAAAKHVRGHHTCSKTRRATRYLNQGKFVDLLYCQGLYVLARALHCTQLAAWQTTELLQTYARSQLLDGLLGYQLSIFSMGGSSIVSACCVSAKFAYSAMSSSSASGRGIAAAS